MQIVAAVVGRADRGRIARVADRLVEIDHRVVGFARPDPLVDGLALCLAIGGVVEPGQERLERREGPSIDLEAHRMRPINDLKMAGNDIGSRSSGKPDVVDAYQDDQVARAGLHEYVTIKTR